MKISKDQKVIKTLLSDRAPKKYQGKEVVVIEGKVYLFPKDDKKAGEFLNSLIKKHPGSIPTLTFVTKPGMYILLANK